MRKAIKQYNAQAEKLNPPHAHLSWNQVVDYSFLAEFDILRFASSITQNQLWTKPAYREAAVKYFKLCCAREEIMRLNIEIRCLQTLIKNETLHTEQVLSHLSVQDSPLAAELRDWWEIRDSMNRIHLQQFAKLAKQSYYTGEVMEEMTLDSTSLADDDDVAEQERDFRIVTDFTVNIADE
jgi:hypothetical protein